MKVVYLGTPDVAVPPLRAIVAAGHEVSMVVSAPDRRRGRGSDLIASPVKAAAVELGLPVTDDLGDLASVDAEMGVVVAYGQILRPVVIDRYPFVNLHFSLLPRWRGAAPVERAILSGDETTGVCVMEVAEGLDTGAVYASASTVVDRKTLDDLRGELIETGTRLLLDVMATTERDGVMPTAVPQEGEPTYAHKLTPEDHRVDWSRTAEEIARVVRLGRAWTTVNGQRLRMRTASLDEGSGACDVGDGVVVPTGAGDLTLIEVQPEGKRAMPAADWLRGLRLDAPPELGT